MGSNVRNCWDSVEHQMALQTKKFETFYNDKYVKLSLGKLNFSDTNRMLISDTENTAKKVLKLAFTILTLGLGPLLYFGFMKCYDENKERILSLVGHPKENQKLNIDFPKVLNPPFRQNRKK